jgi:hypothetical protein
VGRILAAQTWWLSCSWTTIPPTLFHNCSILHVRRSNLRPRPLRGNPSSSADIRNHTQMPCAYSIPLSRAPMLYANNEIMRYSTRLLRMWLMQFARVKPVFATSAAEGSIRYHSSMLGAWTPLYPPDLTSKRRAFEFQLSLLPTHTTRPHGASKYPVLNFWSPAAPTAKVADHTVALLHPPEDSSASSHLVHS